MTGARTLHRARLCRRELGHDEDGVDYISCDHDLGQTLERLRVHPRVRGEVDLDGTLVDSVHRRQGEVGAVGGIAVRLTEGREGHAEILDSDLVAAISQHLEVGR